MVLAYIPAPPTNAVHVGPLTIRLYAACIILGVIAAVWLTERRWVDRGGRRGTPSDIAAWAVPAGLVGARVYHVITSPELYFGAGKDWVDVFYVWHGGLGIWGAIAGGVLGAMYAARRYGVHMLPFIDAAAPGVVIAQAIGRWGNYFNQELFGRHTDLPWALKVTQPEGDNPPGLYHPTFLYESLWNLGVAGLVIWADRRFRLGYGRAFALYVAAYTAGRAWIEALRIDHANHYFGLRLNDYVSIGVFLIAVGYLIARRGSGREDVVQEPRSGDEAGDEQARPQTPAGVT